jgi:pimeloyl-ACP methyl ester carboxylesterase
VAKRSQSVKPSVKENARLFEMTIVVGGWSFSPHILEPVFGPDARYIDSNSLVADVVDETGAIATDWRARLVELLHDETPQEPYRLIGWSMGAMIAYACADTVKPRELILLSPTLSFVRRPEHRFGMNAGVVRRMRGALVGNRDETIHHFQENCGVAKEYVGRFVSDVDTRVLEKGLMFLESVDLRSIALPKVPIRVMYGSDDRIIPPPASRHIAERCACPSESFPGGHAFFLGNRAMMPNAD